MTHLAWSRSHGEIETVVIPMASAAPPVHGGGTASADALTAISRGGADGLSSSERPSMWELLTDTAEDVAVRSPLTLLLEQLEESPAFRRGQVAGALAELQMALEQVTHQGNGEAEVSLQAGTVVVLAHTLLRHQP